MSAGPRDLKDERALLKRLGFAPSGHKKRSVVFERGGVRVALPMRVGDPRGLQNWFHTNRAKLEGDDGQHG